MNLMLLNNLPNASLQLKAIFQAFSDWIFILDEKGTILDYKAGAVACFPSLPEASVGHRIQDFLPSEVGDNFLKAFQWLGQSQNKDAPPFEYSLKLENAEQWFEARLVRAQEQIIVIIRDITKHKQAEEKTQRQLRRLAALRSIDLAISSSLDLNLALSVVLSQVTAQLNVDAADILLFNPQNSMLEFANGVGFRTDALQHTHLQIGEGYAGLAALKREVVNVPNLKNRKTGFLRSPKFAQEDFHSYYGVPLMAKGRVRGVLEIFQRAPLTPDSEWLDFLDMLAGQAAIAVENAMLLKELQRTNFELTLAYNTTIEGWSRALDLRDRDTEGHTQRVTDMALMLARRLGLSETELVNIRRGALLHDIGKMAVPDSILMKPGPLSEEEWGIIRQHPRYAYELLSSISYLGSALDIPHYHHEKWDGSGYPHGLKENQIPLYARLFAVIDVYDALTSNRPYRLAWPKEKAVVYIQDEMGKHFDPAIANEFLNMIQVGP
jgi:putative nucleotidyltransferase with HDIG domain